VVGIGGGKTLDTAKAIGYYQKLPVVVILTIASPMRRPARCR
jgi:glycerol dehydrogenase